ncbi:PLDc N-terminal domain-containing protein [Cellulophaga baltica 4]|nr:PLDc N-terminal domain-containing protein [Cellulophaga baltica 4]
MGLQILIILYVLVALTLVVSILLHGAKPSKTLGWLLAIFTVPVGGILLYLLLGRNRRKNKLIRLKKERFFKFPKPSIEQTVVMRGQFKKIMTLVYKNSHFPPTGGNELVLLKDGKTTFETIFKALEAAKFTIHLQYYIFEEGELADAFLKTF